MTTLEQNIPVLDLCGIRAWWDKGYTGKLGLSATPEYLDVTLPLLEGMVTDGRDSPGTATAHGYQTAMIHRMVMPERKIVMLDLDKAGTDAQKLIDLGVDAVYKSQSTTSKQSEETPYDAALDKCTLFCSSGNYGDDGYNKFMNSACWFGVGAVRLENGSVVTEGYTSESDEVDFAGFANLYIPNAKGNPYLFNGTSCACPFIAGQAGLINELMLAKAGYTLTAAQMYAYLKAHGVDVDDTGCDVRTGWGYVVLPAPDVAARELFQLAKIGDRLYAEAKAAGTMRNTAAYYLSLVKDWRAA